MNSTLRRVFRPAVVCALLWSCVDFPFADAAQTGTQAPSLAGASLPGGDAQGRISINADQTATASAGYVSGPNLGAVTGPFAGTNINAVVGADAFYSHGFEGGNAVISNIEAGHIWSNHEALGHVQQLPNSPLALNEFDRHATWVGMTLGGRSGGDSPGAYQVGMAPAAQLYSGAIASQWSGARTAFSFSFNVNAFLDQYRRAFQTGVDGTGRKADVINSSFGGGDITGTSALTVGVDGLANANHRTLFVNSAGNLGAGPDQVGAPGAGYNDLTVAALGANPTYNLPSSFSSGGPNDYADPFNGAFDNARQVVDIAAPGQQLSLAYYGGETGGNGLTDNPSVGGPGPTGPADGPAGGANFYTRGIAGTSFAAPTVAGGAALLYDAAYAEFAGNADARDARVVKAVLMNSATKTSGWNNGQISHPNGLGGVQTGQGLDDRVGAGRMNLDAAFHQYFEGTADLPGTASGNLGQVDEIGWDFGQVLQGTTNDYYFQNDLAAGANFTATLTWFRDRRLEGNAFAFDDSYDDLDLELWSVAGGVPDALISESFSAFNNTEHFSFALPAAGEYALRVRWWGEVFDFSNDLNLETYALAWSTRAIPEPSAALQLILACSAAAMIKTRR